MMLHRHSDARAFLERAEPWLMTREIEHAVVLQSARQARANDAHYERPIYWATFEDGGELVGCAYRTPPFKVGVTGLPGSAIAPLVADLAATYSGSVAGFSGPDPTVSELATAWVALRGGAWSINTRGRLMTFATAPTSEAAGTNGVLRLAGGSDAALAQTWGAAASLDSGVAALDGNLCVQLLRSKLLYFWVVDGQARCMIGLLRETRDSLSVGIVYTPAAFRGQGHGTAAFTALNRLLDERGVKNRYLWVDPQSDAAQALAAKLGCRFVYDSLDIDCA